MIKFVLTVLVLVQEPGGIYRADTLTQEFKTYSTCEQARKFAVEEITKTKDALVIDARCVKITEV